jgi:DNA processing protein
LVETANDILEEIAPQLNVWLQQDKAPATVQGHLALTTGNALPDTDTFDPEYAQVLDALGYEPLPIDRIILNTGLTAEAVSSILLMLELHNLVAACGGGHYMRLGSGTGN